MTDGRLNESRKTEYCIVLTEKTEHEETFFAGFHKIGRERERRWKLSEAKRKEKKRKERRKQ